MKLPLTLLGGMFLLLAGMSEAQAVVCARGAWHAGCRFGPGFVFVLFCFHAHEGCSRCLKGTEDGVCC